MFKKVIYKFAKSPIKVVDPEKLLFDETGKCLLYRMQNGEDQLRWTVRGISLFTILNTVLSSQEFINPLFGGWNAFSYTICTLAGVSGLAFLKIYARRTVHEIRLLKPGDFVEIKYFNAFWTPKVETVHVSEFTELMESYFGFHRMEITSFGKAWISLEKNAAASELLDSQVLLRVLSGLPVQLDTLKSWKKMDQK